MDEVKINIAIAESLGWRFITDRDKHQRQGLFGIPPNSEANDHNLKPIPNYTADLNAIHEAELLVIYSNNKFPKKYTQQIKAAICRELGIKKAQMDFDICITATALQRCVAYLKTIGKWED
jgi:hypothetical protein